MLRWIHLGISGLSSDRCSNPFDGNFLDHRVMVNTVDYRCEDRKKFGELGGDVGAIR